MKLLKYCLTLLLLIGAEHGCLAQNKRDTLNILFVGNSYTYVSNIPHVVSILSDSTQTKLMTAKSTVGGARLSDHWKGEKGLKTKELIKNGNFDIVVLQEQSMGTIEQADSFLIYSKKLSDFSKEHGARPYFYSTWARQKVPQFQETITKVYTQAALENDGGIVNVGEAWALAQKLRPDIDLFLSDGSHPSPLGAFLAACMFVQEFSLELPDKINPWGFTVLDSRGEQILLMIQDPLDITFCLKVVSEVSKK
ncbi:MAG: hypothetical protein RIB47_01485 [Cyclobacteriaceae bacterium]